MLVPAARPGLLSGCPHKLRALFREPSPDRRSAPEFSTGQSSARCRVRSDDPAIRARCIAHDVAAEHLLTQGGRGDSVERDVMEPEHDKTAQAALAGHAGDIGDEVHEPGSVGQVHRCVPELLHESQRRGPRADPAVDLQVGGRREIGIRNPIRVTDVCR